MKQSDSNQKPKNPVVSEVTKAHTEMSRRNFLATGAAAMVVPLIVPRHIIGGSDYQAPSDKLRIAAVGLGSGARYLEGCSDEHIVALCDLDHNLKAKVFEKYPHARRYRDYRIMFEKEAKNIDAVIIATPDHTHTMILMAAIELGKHIYCAKPVTHTIGEARRVKKKILENKQLVTMTSVQSAGKEEARSTSELLRSGVIGNITELHVWCKHPIYAASLTHPTEKQTPPRGMDWDMWIGPAPYRPYNEAYHPWKWRPWHDFGSGAVGDMCCHSFHSYFDELKLGAPKNIYGTGSTRYEGINKKVPTPECQSSANMVTWEFPARENLLPVNVHWYDGGMKPLRPAELDHKYLMPDSGLLFVGEKGKLLAGFGGGRVFKDHGNNGGLLLPEEKFQGFQDPPKTMYRVKDHYKNWTEGCKTGEKTVCPVEYGCEMTELGLLGALALRTNKLLEWDAKAMKVTNQGDDINILVDPPYRKGWEI